MIQVSHLSFSYTKNPFIQDMSFSVEEGEILGFLGPSGAGKSTLQKILLGLLPHYQGSAMVNGTECKHRGADFYESIGVDFEFSTLYEKLTAKENLQFFSSLYRRQVRAIPELLARVGLEHDADKRVSDCSKGMKSRLNFVKALLHDPRLLFLDEPTSGLDPANSRLMKDMILEEKRKGKTILLTTHNMLDAAELCDRVAFIVGGKILRWTLPTTSSCPRERRRSPIPGLTMENSLPAVPWTGCRRISSFAPLWRKTVCNPSTAASPP